MSFDPLWATLAFGDDLIVFDALPGSVFEGSFVDDHTQRLFAAQL